ncbi:MAG: AraC family transcriptional regulator [Gammaproteobacteria bacterium]
MSQDTLSDVLRTVRLRSAVFYFVSGEGDWVAEAPASSEIAGVVMPDADHVIEYHVVTSGECWAAIVGEQPRKLKQGDIILLPQGDAHVVSSAPGMRATVDVESQVEMQPNQRPFRVHYANGGSPVSVHPHNDGPAFRASDTGTTLVCGFIGVDARPFNPLLATLPRLLHLPGSGGRSEQFAHLAAEESARKRPGAEALLERLSEMMFVDAIRRHVEQLPDQSTGWLAGLRDRFVGRALALLHDKPAAEWTVEELSRQVGLSRSAFHERFVELIGQPPMQYLTQWRMQAASRLLRDTRASVASVALDVGYDSEAAFARAFKRAAGVPPAAWRRQQDGANRPATATPLEQL